MNHRVTYADGDGDADRHGWIIDWRRLTFESPWGTTEHVEHVLFAGDDGTITWVRLCDVRSEKQEKEKT